MTKKIAIHQLPEWAQEKVLDKGNDFCSISRDEGSLRIFGDEVTFNGMEVVETLDDAAKQEDTISFYALPLSIQRQILTTLRSNGTIQSMTDGSTLRIDRTGLITYNGMMVIAEAGNFLEEKEDA